MCAACPWEEQCEEPLELFYVDAVLLQVGQARVVAAHGVTSAAPVTAGQMLCLMKKQTWIRCETQNV